jgi:hypothetical protein
VAETKKRVRDPKRLFSIYVGGPAKRKALEDRAARLGYKSFSEFVAAHLEAAPDVPCMELPRLRAVQEARGCSLSEALAAGR